MVQKYGCSDYRTEMMLAGLKKQLSLATDETEKKRLEKEIAELEETLFGAPESLQSP